jgi:bacterioferritin-associated ferredoxin
MIVCVCHAVSDKQIRQCARLGCGSLEELSFELGVGTQCGCCREVAQEVLADECGRSCACAGVSGWMSPLPLVAAA